jgi:hypothetical protein
MNTKEKLHILVDQIQDEKLLKAYLDLLENRAKEVVGKLWNTLSNQEKEELFLSYEDSFDDDNLIDNKEVKSKFKKWL